jgi:hypothetical protein
MGLKPSQLKRKKKNLEEAKKAHQLGKKNFVFSLADKFEFVEQELIWNRFLRANAGKELEDVKPRWTFSPKTEARDLDAFRSIVRYPEYPIKLVPMDEYKKSAYLAPKITNVEAEIFHNYLQKTAGPFHEFARIFQERSGLEMKLDDTRWNHCTGHHGSKDYRKVFCTMQYQIRSSSHQVELSWDWEKRQVEIFIIAVRNQGKGEGSKLMELIKTISEETGMGLRLFPIQHITLWGTYSFTPQLKKWYARLGFTPEENSPYMIYNV